MPSQRIWLADSRPGYCDLQYPQEVYRAWPIVFFQIRRLVPLSVLTRWVLTSEPHNNYAKDV